MVQELALVDLLIFTAVGVGVIVGLVRGFFLQFAGLAGVVGGFFVADRYYAELGATLNRVLEVEQATTIAFILIMVCTVLVVTLICALCRRALGSLKMGSYDRLLGGIFGGLKASLLCAGILLAIVALAPQEGGVRGSIGSSRSGPLLWEAVDRMAGVLPKKTRLSVREFLHDNEVRKDAPPPTDRGLFETSSEEEESPPITVGDPE